MFASFFKEKNFKAINVTIPYKQTVIPYLDSVSDISKRIGAVNTIV
ncbi:MAG: shikimate dehydrogenase, partial [Bacteroidales bacterium]|nr:shikimate dehydrogenase [Bacteroidales bacterium]